MDDRGTFSQQLDELIASRREEMRAKYDRVLPTGELLFNRFDKGAYLNVGQGSSVYDASVVMGDVVIGSHVWVGPYTLLDGSHGRITIGDFTSIDTGVLIYSHDSTKYYVSGGVSPFVSGPVTIGSNTVIGSRSMIACNVAIGDRCVVAAGSYVNQDVPDGTIVAGTPAKPIGRVVIRPDGSAEFCYERKEQP